MKTNEKYCILDFPEYYLYETYEEAVADGNKLLQTYANNRTDYLIIYEAKSKVEKHTHTNP